MKNGRIMCSYEVVSVNYSETIHNLSSLSSVVGIKSSSWKSNNKTHKHQDNMSVRFIPPCTPHLYSKTGVYKGIHYFLIFAPEHRLWVRVEAVITSTHDLCFGAKIRKKNMYTPINPSFTT